MTHAPRSDPAGARQRRRGLAPTALAAALALGLVSPLEASPSVASPSWVHERALSQARYLEEVLEVEVASRWAPPGAGPLRAGVDPARLPAEAATQDRLVGLLASLCPRQSRRFTDTYRRLAEPLAREHARLRDAFDAAYQARYDAWRLPAGDLLPALDLSGIPRALDALLGLDPAATEAWSARQTHARAAGYAEEALAATARSAASLRRLQRLLDALLEGAVDDPPRHAYLRRLVDEGERARAEEFAASDEARALRAERAHP